MEYGFDSAGSICRTGFSFPCFLDDKKFFYGTGGAVCESAAAAAEKCYAAKLSGGFGTDRFVAAASQFLCNNVAVCDGDGDFLQSDSIRIFKI